jgi:hypothetical protein
MGSTENSIRYVDVLIAGGGPVGTSSHPIPVKLELLYNPSQVS